MAMYSTSRWGSSTRSSKGSSRTTKRPVPGYQSIYNTLNNKIASYKFLTTQAMGPAKFNRPTPASLNSFGKWIEKGAVVHRVTNTQLRKWSNSNQQFKTVAAAKNCIERRFGKGPIKAIIPNKTGGFLVATTPTWKGKNFKFPR